MINEKDMYNKCVKKPNEKERIWSNEEIEAYFPNEKEDIDMGG